METHVWNTLDKELPYVWVPQWRWGTRDRGRVGEILQGPDPTRPPRPLARTDAEAVGSCEKLVGGLQAGRVGLCSEWEDWHLRGYYIKAGQKACQCA